nr:uncharacterized protein LOC105854827 [Microcebus murinus]
MDALPPRTQDHHTFVQGGHSSRARTPLPPQLALGPCPERSHQQQLPLQETTLASPLCACRRKPARQVLSFCRMGKLRLGSIHLSERNGIQKPTLPVKHGSASPKEEMPACGFSWQLQLLPPQPPCTHMARLTWPWLSGALGASAWATRVPSAGLARARPPGHTRPPRAGTPRPTLSLAGVWRRGGGCSMLGAAPALSGGLLCSAAAWPGLGLCSQLCPVWAGQCRCPLPPPCLCSLLQARTRESVLGVEGCREREQSQGLLSSPLASGTPLPAPPRPGYGPGAQQSSLSREEGAGLQPWPWLSRPGHCLSRFATLPTATQGSPASLLRGLLLSEDTWHCHDLTMEAIATWGWGHGTGG